jgi:hypothetical protein
MLRFKKVYNNNNNRHSAQCARFKSVYSCLYQKRFLVDHWGRYDVAATVPSLLKSAEQQITTVR